MKYENLTRGVIYGDSDVIEFDINETVDAMNFAADESTKFYRESGLESAGCPNEKEFIVSTVVDLIRKPSDDFENMVIPSNLVDKNLYHQLKKIDIGDQLAPSFIKERCAKFVNTNTQKKDNLNRDYPDIDEIHIKLDQDSNANIHNGIIIIKGIEL